MWLVFGWVCTWIRDALILLLGCCVPDDFILKSGQIFHFK